MILISKKSIIKEHGREIWGKNNDNARGAEFGFTLPIEEEDI